VEIRVRHFPVVPPRDFAPSTWREPHVQTESHPRGDGKDWIDCGASPDDLNGDNGDDFLDGGLHNDSLRGGDGRDTCRSGEVRMSSCEL
jgi:hypothetical protein